MKSVKPSVDGDDVNKLKGFTDDEESPTQERTIPNQEEETQDFGHLVRLNPEYKETDEKELAEAIVSHQEKAKCLIM